LDKHSEDFDVERNDQACQVIRRKHESILKHMDQCKEADDLPILLEEDETTKSDQLESSVAQTSQDGAILRNEERTFSNPHNLSPILKISHEQRLDESCFFNQDSICELSARDSVKRKRVGDDSINDISIMSVESTKKLKLSRAGSLKKHLGRRMSFGIKPINDLFRSRKTSADPNSSSCSNFETTFNESIKEPIKEKFRQFKETVSKIKKDVTTPKSTKPKPRFGSSNTWSKKDANSQKRGLCEDHSSAPEEHHETEFKTPKAKGSTPYTQSSLFVSNSLKKRAKIETSEKTADIEGDLSIAECKSVIYISATLEKILQLSHRFHIVKEKLRTRTTCY
jgi:hypothetical protein